MVDEHPSQDYALNLPPHIEARFFKKRCRTSGLNNSSNSATSLHPTERAQTRRAKILETRKNNLRARALHAEKVRTRSQTNSHEALAARLTALQKSLSRAQKSRNALLAKTAAQCSHEVAKAKQVAQQIKQRREEEAKALRDGMEDRLMEAEKRRLELQNAKRNRKRSTSRGSLSSNVAEEGVVESPTHTRLDEVDRQKEIEAEAAVAIQRAYRLNRNRIIVKKFIELGLSIESIRDTAFEEVTALFREEQVQKATERLLRLCGLLQFTTDSVGKEDVLDTEKACRTFLSSYVILGHPAQVLSNDGEEEKALITKSKDLLVAFESWISSTSPVNSYAGSPYLRDSLSSAWDDFSTAFSSWKERDVKDLLDHLLRSFAELDLIWQKVKDDNVQIVTEDYKEGIREAQVKLLVKIRNLAGDKTRGLVKKAVMNARRTRLPKKQDHKPRSVDADNADNADTIVHTPPSPVSPVPSSSASLLEQPPSMEDPKLLMGLTNREIIHELALDKEFRLKPMKKSLLEVIVENEARRAFSDLMREGMQNKEDWKWIPQLASTIKRKLVKLCDNSKTLRKMVEEAIDIPFIEQQCRVGSYDYKKLFAFVFSLLPRICSPARDAEVEALINSEEDYIQCFWKLVDLLDNLILDNTNYMLMRSAPILIPQAIPYERQAFAADLAAGKTKLNKTKEALLKARDEKLTECRSRDPETLSNPANLPNATVIYNHAFMALTVSLAQLQKEDVWETFHLDVERIIGFRKAVKQIVLSSALLLMVKNLLRRDVRAPWKDMKDRVVNLLDKAVDNQNSTDLGTEICLFIQETSALPPAAESHIKSAVTRITASNYADPVVRLVFNRLKTFISARLNAVSARERIKLASNATETLINFGMPEQVGDVAALMEILERVAVLNRNIYGAYYDQILSGEEGQGSSR